MRVLCLIPGLGPGGAERVMTTIANHLSIQHDVVLVTWERPGTEPFYPVADAVQRIQLNLSGAGVLSRVEAFGLRAPALRRLVLKTRPQIVLSFLDSTNITALMACLGLKVGLVVSERIEPQLDRSWLVRVSRALLYPLADAVVVQTTRVARCFPPGLQDKITVIPNPVDATASRADPALPAANGRFRIVGVGRLEHQKGFDRLVEAFSLVASRYPLWDVIIFGEGCERASLAEQIGQAGLTKRVLLPGVRPAIADELAASHIMCFPSRFEGFPNALAEAAIAGLPAVGYDGVSGVEEIIIPGATGTLLPATASPAELAAALEELIADVCLRCEMGRAASLHARRWATDRVLPQWETLLVAACDAS